MSFAAQLAEAVQPEVFARRKTADGKAVTLYVDGYVKLGKRAAFRGKLKKDQLRLYAGEVETVDADQLQYLAMAVRRSSSPGDVRKSLDKILGDAERMGASERRRTREMGKWNLPAKSGQYGFREPR